MFQDSNAGIPEYTTHPTPSNEIDNPAAFSESANRFGQLHPKSARSPRKFSMIQHATRNRSDDTLSTHATIVKQRQRHRRANQKRWGQTTTWPKTRRSRFNRTTVNSASTPARANVITMTYIPPVQSNLRTDETNLSSPFSDEDLDESDSRRQSKHRAGPLLMVNSTAKLISTRRTDSSNVIRTVSSATKLKRVSCELLANRIANTLESPLRLQAPESRHPSTQRAHHVGLHEATGGDGGGADAHA